MTKPFNWDDFETDSGFDWNQFETEAPQVSQLESGARGAAQGATMGLADELAGGFEALWDKAIKGDKGALVELYKKHRDESRAAFEAAQRANPDTYAVGELGGAVAAGLATGGTGTGATLGRLAAQGAIQGGIAGLGHSEAELTDPTLSNIQQAAIDTASGAGMGAAGGAAGYAVGKGVSAAANSKAGQKAAQWVGDKLQELAEVQSARAMGAERGTIKKLGMDKVREIGKYGLDEKIVTPLASTDDMIARNAKMQKVGADKMNAVYQAIDEADAGTFNPLSTAAQIDEQVGGFWRSPINKGETRQLENTLESVLMRGDENISMAEAQALKEELGKVANWKNNVSITDKERMAREAYGIVSKAIDDATEQGAQTIGADGLLQTLKQGKKLYSNSKGAEELLTNKAAREQGNKTFGITDNIIGGAGLVGAIPTGGSSVLVSTGAVVAKKAAEKYGSQVTAVTAKRLSEIVRQAPQKLGKYAPVLQGAAARGGQSLAAAHYVLQQQDPEYRETVKRATDEEGP